MKTRASKILWLMATLVVAATSALFLNHPWHMAVVQGHQFGAFPGTEFTLMDAVISVPLIWPFLIAGLIIGVFAGGKTTIAWVVAAGIGGAALCLLLNRMQFAPEVPLGCRLSYYIVLVFPLLLSSIGFYVGQYVKR